VRLILAIIFTISSLTLLLWSLWPYGRITRRQFIQPTEMLLPTQGSFVPLNKPA
jgi:uncharacterized membrane protein YccF (DUF307 family)